MTREEMLKERRNARRNAVLSYIGQNEDINNGYSERLIEFINNNGKRKTLFAM